MEFVELSLPGVYFIKPEPIYDHRGFNARLWCEDTFIEQGIDFLAVQENVISNGPAGTLRGFHYQVPPHSEAKLFQVRRGAIFDVVVDLRPQSPTYLRWVSVELRANNLELLFIPEGCAQGFQTLTVNTEVLYRVSHQYSPEHERGFRYDDPTFAILWPLPVTAISEKDRTWPLFADGCT